MLPTRVNFPDRWANDLLCVYCKRLDTDAHLFTCWGYLDITGTSTVERSMFYHLNATKEELSEGAKILIRIHDRLVIAQGDNNLNDEQ